MKKFLSLLMAALMVFALCAPAMAEAPAVTAETVNITGSLTVKLPTGQDFTDAKFYAYQALDIALTKAGQLKYTWATWVPGDITNAIDFDTATEIKFTDEQTKALEAAMPGSGAQGTATVGADESTAVFTGLKPGIYMIQGTDAVFVFKPIMGSIQIRGSAAEDGEVEAKESKYDKPGLNKTINGNEDYDTVGVGDTVTFDLYVPNIPDYPNTFTATNEAHKPTFTLTDTMSAGLTYSTTNFAKVEDVNGTVLATLENYGNDGEAGSQTFVYTFTDIYQTQLKNYAGKVLHVQYKAIVNSAAITDSAHKNKVTLKYNNGSESDSVEYYTYGIAFEKVDGKSNAALPNVEFSLTEDSASSAMTFKKGTDDKYYPDATNTADDATVLKTDANGKVQIAGLDEGTYKLKETKTLADDGYVLLSDEKEIKLERQSGDGANPANLKDDNDNVFTFKEAIKNYKGFALPSTGGMGTTVFMVVGIALMAGVVVVMLVSNRKKAKKAE